LAKVEREAQEKAGRQREEKEREKREWERAERESRERERERRRREEERERETREELEREKRREAEREAQQRRRQEEEERECARRQVDRYIAQREAQRQIHEEEEREPARREAAAKSAGDQKESACAHEREKPREVLPLLLALLSQEPPAPDFASFKFTEAEARQGAQFTPAQTHHAQTSVASNAQQQVPVAVGINAPEQPSLQEYMQQQRMIQALRRQEVPPPQFPAPSKSLLQPIPSEQQHSRPQGMVTSTVANGGGGGGGMATSTAAGGGGGGEIDSGVRRTRPALQVANAPQNFSGRGVASGMGGGAHTETHSHTHKGGDVHKRHKGETGRENQRQVGGQVLQSDDEIAVLILEVVSDLMRNPEFQGQPVPIARVATELFNLHASAKDTITRRYGRGIAGVKGFVACPALRDTLDVLQTDAGVRVRLK
jgi:hypothetical protein